MMVNETEQFPTRGDLAREQLRRRGVPDFMDVQAEVYRRLERLPRQARQAFALACAERLMARHERLPLEAQRPFTFGWRPVLDAIWIGLVGDADVARQAQRRVAEALDTFQASPYDHQDGQEGPDEADEDAAAASIYAAECFVGGDAQYGDAQCAAWAARRAVDAAFMIAEQELDLDPNDFVWDPSADPPMRLAQEAMHPAVQDELRRQLADLRLLEREGVTATAMRQLRGQAEPG